MSDENAKQPEHLKPMVHTSPNSCFGCGAANPSGLHLEFSLCDDKSVVSLLTVPANFEGPVSFVHGGIIATILDEAMSKSIRAHGITSLTRQMEVEYLRPVYSGTPIRVEGRMVRNEERKYWAEARILNARGAHLATGKGLFIEVQPRKTT
jgi:uncharacterized protein (TIGR00369 family)